MNKTKIILLQSIVALLPLIYLGYVFNSLPEIVPTHFDSNFVPNDYSNKKTLFGILIFMGLISVGTSALVLNLNKIDPKRKYATDNPVIKKITWTIVIFISLISISIVYETVNFAQKTEMKFSPKYFILLIALLFATLGNFMNNIKANYFVGIRSPWALEDEENWRLTHHLAAKIWFWGGLLMAILIIALPQESASLILSIGIAPLVLLPFGYSYVIFRKKQKQKNS